MEITRFIDREQRKVLANARETYGDTKQILVSNEELCELAAVCAKFPRYDTRERAQTELHQSALDEVADVLIVLDHIVSIFNLHPEEIQERVSGKINRLNRWIHKSTSMEYTTEDRAVSSEEDVDYAQLSLFDTPCMKCAHEKTPKSAGRCKGCKPNYLGFIEKLPCSNCKHICDFKALKPGGRCYMCVHLHGGMFEPNKEK
jgi:hypothetical protein